MDKRHKEIMSALVGKLRHILVGTPADHGFEPGDLDRELERLGIDREGEVTPIDALASASARKNENTPGDERDSMEKFHNGDGRTYRVAATQLQRLPAKERRTARREIVERAAYTWINRLLALRAMEVRGLIDDTLRVSEDYGGISEKLYLLRMEKPAEATKEDGGWWTVLRETCAELAKALPGLFSLDDPDASLHPTAGALIQCIDLVGGKQPVLPNVSLAELDAALADPDAIGWAYQFYQAEAKAEIDAKCKSGGKAASRAELAAKTQLFTEPYMVQWLLQNSLGRSYVEAYPQSSLSASWPYYIQPEENSTRPEKIFPLAELTLLDPCMGSGHFLRAAFDMFVAMYREQHPEMSAEQIANRVLSQHLFGIDLDPRAAQLSALTLYLRAWEIVKAERRGGDMSLYIPPEMHLATTPTNLDRGALERHIQRYPDDIVYKPLLEKVFAGLEQADILGSLLRSREYLDQAILDLQMPHTIPMVFSQAQANLISDVTELAHTNPTLLRQMLLDRVAASFHAEATRTDDVSMALFGREAERGVRLLQVLDGRYAVVATNPPYLGSAYMDDSLRKYVTKYYKAGKRDLYAAFILRCLELCKSNGRVAMVTMHSWMFLRSFAELRALPEEQWSIEQKKGSFTGILREAGIEALAHLGPSAFEEISGEVVQSVMFTLTNIIPRKEHQIIAFRLVGMKSASEKQTTLLTMKERANNKIIAMPYQRDFLSIPDAPLVYYLDKDVLPVLIHNKRVKEVAEIKQGLATADDNHFLRYTWELPFISHRWATFTKGGGYCKWFGHNWYHVDWEYKGSRLQGFGKSVLRNTTYYFSPGWSYSRISRGSIGIRLFDMPGCIGDKGPGIYTNDSSLISIAQSHAFAFMLRAVSPQLAFEINTIVQAPLPAQSNPALPIIVKLAESLKNLLVSSTPMERTFSNIQSMADEHQIASLLHTVEGFTEQIVCQDYRLTEATIQTIIAETGTPAGWYPLIAGYDRLPNLPEDIDDQPELPQELYDYL
ncbi:MAG TPA: BREX-1 system adenine-specific DNA-methyltransferase PglX, partial [Ktedonobacteraceae bacterium]|nr:BREX-1 system adenine-specific DNA-methyltransferase PglX [Ktedonobacteraceae bacterium]